MPVRGVLEQASSRVRWCIVLATTENTETPNSRMTLSRRWG